MGSAAWKERNEALDSAEKAMKDANNIKDNIGSDFPVAIKVCGLTSLAAHKV